jgi:hypothetical protein
LHRRIDLHYDIYIKELYNKFVIKLQESFLTLGSKKRIQLMLYYIDIRPSDVLLDVSGNIGKITVVYARGCKEIVILEPKHTLDLSNTTEHIDHTLNL